MLRTLALASILFSTCAFAEEPSEKPSEEALPEYVAPTQEEMERLRGISQQVLEQANKLRGDKEFVNEVDKQRKMANQQSSLEVGVKVEQLTAGRDTEDLNITELLSQARQTETPNIPVRDRPLVLISLSMPENEIKGLLRELKKIDSGVVIRGLVNNDFKETVTRMREMSSEDGSTAGVAIDPTVFQRFKVESVPTFILPLEPVPLCNAHACVTPRHLKATGSVSLAYFLETVVRTAENEEEKNAALRWLERLNQ